MDEVNKYILNPRKILIILFMIIALLLLCHIVGVTHKTLVGNGFITYTFEPLFNLDTEGTIPSYFSSLFLIFVSIILASIAFDLKTKPFRNHWLLMSLVFLYLSFDECCGIHEILGKTVRIWIGSNGWLYHIAPFLPILTMFIILSLFFINFLLSLPPKVKIRFGFSAFIYLMGAIVMDVVGSFYMETLVYQVIMPIEEIMEMIGVSLFIYSLLIYKEKYGYPIIINIKSNEIV